MKLTSIPVRRGRGRPKIDGDPVAEAVDRTSAMVYYGLRDLSLVEIAEALDCYPATLRKRIQRALLKAAKDNDWELLRRSVLPRKGKP